MKSIDFQQMSRSELRAYLLEHREDKLAFQAYMDKLANEPVLASGTLADLEDAERFAVMLENIRKMKEEA